METFLKLVAHDLYTKTNGDFTRTAIVFPNKRAGLFFNEYLASETDRPIWSPNKVAPWNIARDVRVHVHKHVHDFMLVQSTALLGCSGLYHSALQSTKDTE